MIDEDKWNDETQVTYIENCLFETMKDYDRYGFSKYNNILKAIGNNLNQYFTAMENNLVDPETHKEAKEEIEEFYVQHPELTPYVENTHPQIAFQNKDEKTATKLKKGVRTVMQYAHLP